MYLSAGVYIYDLVVCVLVPGVHCISGGLYVPGMVYCWPVCTYYLLGCGYVYICMCQCVLCGLCVPGGLCVPASNIR